MDKALEIHLVAHFDSQVSQRNSWAGHWLDITYSVNILSQFMDKPSEIYLAAHSEFSSILKELLGRAFF